MNNAYSSFSSFQKPNLVSLSILICTASDIDHTSFSSFEKKAVVVSLSILIRTVGDINNHSSHKNSGNLLSHDKFGDVSPSILIRTASHIDNNSSLKPVPKSGKYQLRDLEGRDFGGEDDYDHHRHHDHRHRHHDPSFDDSDESS